MTKSIPDDRIIRELGIVQNNMRRFPEYITIHRLRVIIRQIQLLYGDSYTYPLFDVIVLLGMFGRRDTHIHAILNSVPNMLTRK